MIAVTDASGNVISDSSNIANANPYRYRGYYYDAETGLYYLQSRYYNPEMGRFINSDAIACKVGQLGTHNVFAYCSNDPINNVDQSGLMCFRIGVNGLPYIDVTMDQHFCYANPAPTPNGLYRPTININNKGGNVKNSKQRTLRPDSGLTGIPNDEISRKARDKSIPSSERQRYKREEKQRGLRNKQKRQSNFSIDIPAPSINLDPGLKFFAAVGILAIIADDATGAGVSDDGALIPLFGILLGSKT